MSSKKQKTKVNSNPKIIGELEKEIDSKITATESFTKAFYFMGILDQNGFKNLYKEIVGEKFNEKLANAINIASRIKTEEGIKVALDLIQSSEMNEETDSDRLLQDFPTLNRIVSAALSSPRKENLVEVLGNTGLIKLYFVMLSEDFDEYFSEYFENNLKYDTREKIKEYHTKNKGKMFEAKEYAKLIARLFNP
jgi:hypothetical protein